MEQNPRKNKSTPGLKLVVTSVHAKPGDKKDNARPKSPYAKNVQSSGYGRQTPKKPKEIKAKSPTPSSDDSVNQILSSPEAATYLYNANLRKSPIPDKRELLRRGQLFEAGAAAAEGAATREYGDGREEGEEEASDNDSLSNFNETYLKNYGLIDSNETDPMNYGENDFPTINEMQLGEGFTNYSQNPLHSIPSLIDNDNVVVDNDSNTLDNSSNDQEQAPINDDGDASASDDNGNGDGDGDGGNGDDGVGSGGGGDHDESLLHTVTDNRGLSERLPSDDEEMDDDEKEEEEDNDDGEDDDDSEQKVVKNVYLAQSSFADKIFSSDKRLNGYNKDLFLNLSPVGESVHIRLPASFSSSSSRFDLQKIVKDINEHSRFNKSKSNSNIDQFNVVALRLDCSHGNIGGSGSGSGDNANDVSTGGSNNKAEVFIPPVVADQIITLMGDLQLKLFSLIPESKVDKRARRKALLNAKAEMENYKREFVKTFFFHTANYHLEMMIVSVLLISTVQTFLNLIISRLGDVPKKRKDPFEDKTDLEFAEYALSKDVDASLNQTVVEFLFKIILNIAFNELSATDAAGRHKTLTSFFATGFKFDNNDTISPSIASFINNQDDFGSCSLKDEAVNFLTIATCVAFPLINVRSSESGFQTYAFRKKTGRHIISCEEFAEAMRSRLQGHNGDNADNGRVNDDNGRVNDDSDVCGPLSPASILQNWKKSHFRKQKKENSGIRKLLFHHANHKMAQRKFEKLLPKINKFNSTLHGFINSSSALYLNAGSGAAPNSFGRGDGGEFYNSGDDNNDNDDDDDDEDSRFMKAFQSAFQSISYREEDDDSSGGYWDDDDDSSDSSGGDDDDYNDDGGDDDGGDDDGDSASSDTVEENGGDGGGRDRRGRAKAKPFDDDNFFKNLRNYNKTLNRINSRKYKKNTICLNRGNIVDLLCEGDRGGRSFPSVGFAVSLGPDRFIFNDIERVIKGAFFKTSFARYKRLSEERARNWYLSPRLFTRVQNSKIKNAFKNYMISLVTLLRHGGSTARYVLREWFVLLGNQNCFSETIYDTLIADYEYINSNFNTADQNFLNFTENLRDATQEMKRDKTNKLLGVIFDKINKLTEEEEEEEEAEEGGNAIDPRVSETLDVRFSRNLCDFFKELEECCAGSSRHHEDSLSIGNSIPDTLKPVVLEWLQKIKNKMEMGGWGASGVNNEISPAHFLSVYSEIIACLLAFSLGFKSSSGDGGISNESGTIEKMNLIEPLLDEVIRILGELSKTFVIKNKVILSLPLMPMALKEHACLSESAFKGAVSSLKGFINLPRVGDGNDDDDDDDDDADERKDDKRAARKNCLIPGFRESDYAKNELDRLNVLENKHVKMTMGSLLKPLTKVNVSPTNGEKRYYTYEENRVVGENEERVHFEEGRGGRGGGSGNEKHCSSLLINNDKELTKAVNEFVENPENFVTLYQGDKSVSSLIGGAGIHQGKWVANTVNNYANNFISPLDENVLRNVEPRKVSKALGWNDGGKINELRSNTASASTNRPSSSSALIGRIASSLDTVLRDSLDKTKEIIVNTDRITTLFSKFSNNSDLRKMAKEVSKKIRRINKMYHEHLGWILSASGSGGGGGGGGGKEDFSSSLNFPIFEDKLLSREKFLYDNLKLADNDNNDISELFNASDSDYDGDDDDDNLRPSRKRNNNGNCVLKSESRALAPGSIKVYINSLNVEHAIKYLTETDKVLSKIGSNFQKLQKYSIRNVSNDDIDRMYEKVHTLLLKFDRNNDILKKSSFYNARYSLMIRKFLKANSNTMNASRDEIYPNFIECFKKLMALMGDPEYVNEYITPVTCQAIGVENIIGTLITNYVQGGGETLFKQLIDEIISSGADFNKNDLAVLRKIRNCANSIDTQIKKIKFSIESKNSTNPDDNVRKRRKEKNQLVSERILKFLQRRNKLTNSNKILSDDDGESGGGSDGDDYNSSSNGSGSSSDEESDDGISGDSSTGSWSSSSSSSGSSSSSEEEDEGRRKEGSGSSKNADGSSRRRRKYCNMLISHEIQDKFRKTNKHFKKNFLKKSDIPDLKKRIESNQVNYEKLLKRIRDCVYDDADSDRAWESVFRLVCNLEEIEKMNSLSAPVIQEAFKNANMLWDDYHVPPLSTQKDKKKPSTRGTSSNWVEFLNSEGKRRKQPQKRGSGGGDGGGDDADDGEGDARKLEYLDYLIFEASSLVKDFDRNLYKRVDRCVQSKNALQKSLLSLENGIINSNLRSIKKAGNIEKLYSKRFKFVGDVLNLHDPVIFVNTKKNIYDTTRSLILSKMLNYSLYDGFPGDVSLDDKERAIDTLISGGGVNRNLKSMVYNNNYGDNSFRKNYENVSTGYRNPLLNITFNFFERLTGGGGSNHRRLIDSNIALPVYGIIDVSSEVNSFDSIVYNDIFFKKKPKRFIKYVSKFINKGGSAGGERGETSEGGGSGSSSSSEGNSIFSRYFQTYSPLGPFLFEKRRIENQPTHSSRKDDFRPIADEVDEGRHYEKYFDRVGKRQENFLLKSAYSNMFGEIPFILSIVVNSGGGRGGESGERKKKPTTTALLKEINQMTSEIIDLRKEYETDSNSCVELIDTLNAFPELQNSSSSSFVSKMSKTFSRITVEFKRSFFYLKHLETVCEYLGNLYYECSRLSSYLLEDDAKDFLRQLFLKYRDCLSDWKDEDLSGNNIKKLISRLGKTTDELRIKSSSLLNTALDAIAFIKNSIDLKRNKLKTFFNNDKNQQILENYVSQNAIMKVLETGLDGTYFPLSANSDLSKLTPDERNQKIEKFKAKLYSAYDNKNDRASSYYHSLVESGGKLITSGENNQISKTFNALPNDRKTYFLSSAIGTIDENSSMATATTTATPDFDKNIFKSIFNLRSMDPLNLNTTEFEIANKLVENISTMSYFSSNTRIVLNQFIDNSLWIQYQKRESKGAGGGGVDGGGGGGGGGGSGDPKVDQKLLQQRRGLNLSSIYDNASDYERKNNRLGNNQYLPPAVLKDTMALNEMKKYVEEAEHALERLKNSDIESFLTDLRYFDSSRSEIQSSVVNFNREFEKLSLHHSPPASFHHYPVQAVNDTVTRYFYLFQQFSNFLDNLVESMNASIASKNKDLKTSAEEHYERMNEKVEEEFLEKQNKLKQNQLDHITIENDRNSQIIVMQNTNAEIEKNIENLKREIQDISSRVEEGGGNDGITDSSAILLEKEKLLKEEIGKYEENERYIRAARKEKESAEKSRLITGDAFNALEEEKRINMEENKAHLERALKNIDDDNRAEIERYSDLIKNKSLKPQDDINRMAGKALALLQERASNAIEGGAVGGMPLLDGPGGVGSRNSSSSSSFKFSCFLEDLHDLKETSFNNDEGATTTSTSKFKPSKIVPLVCEFCVKLLFGLHTEVVTEKHNFNFDGVGRLKRLSNVTQKLLSDSNNQKVNDLLRELLFHGPNANFSNLSFKTEKTIIAYTPSDFNYVNDCSLLNDKATTANSVRERTVLLPTSELFACPGHDFVKFRASLIKALDPTLYKNIRKNNTLASNIALLNPNEEYLFFTRKDEKESFSSIRNSVLLSSCGRGYPLKSATDASMCDKNNEFIGPRNLRDLTPNDGKEEESDGSMNKKRKTVTPSMATTFNNNENLITKRRHFRDDNNDIIPSYYSEFLEGKKRKKSDYDDAFDTGAMEPRDVVIRNSSPISGNRYYNLDFGASLICARGANFDRDCNEKFIHFQLNDMSKRMFQQQQKAIEESSLNIGKRLATAVNSITGGAYKANPITVGKIQSLTMSDLNRRFTTNYKFLMLNSGKRRNSLYGNGGDNFYYSFLDIMGKDDESREEKNKNSSSSSGIEKLKSSRDIHLIVPDNAVRTSVFNNFYNYFTINGFKNINFSSDSDDINKEAGNKNGNDVFANIFNLNIEDFVRRRSYNDEEDDDSSGRYSLFAHYNKHNPYSLFNRINFIPFAKLSSLQQRRQNQIVHQRMIDSIEGGGAGGGIGGGGSLNNAFTKLHLRDLMGSFVSTIMATSSPLLYRPLPLSVEEEKCPKCALKETFSSSSASVSRYLHNGERYCSRHGGFGLGPLPLTAASGPSSSSSSCSIFDKFMNSDNPESILKLKNYLRKINEENVDDGRRWKKIGGSTILEGLVDYLDRNDKIIGASSSSDRDRFYQTAKFDIGSMLHRNHAFSNVLKRIMDRNLFNPHERNMSDYIRNVFLKKKSSSSSSSLSSCSAFSSNLSNDFVLPVMSQVPFMGQYLLLERFEELVGKRVNSSILPAVKNRINLGHMENIFNPENKMLSMMYVVVPRDPLHEIARDRILSSVYLTKFLKKMDKAPNTTDIPNLLCENVLLSTATINRNNRDKKNTFLTDTFLACSTDKTSLLNNIRRYEELFHKVNDADQMLRTPKCLCPMTDHHRFNGGGGISKFFSSNQIVSSEELFSHPYRCQKLISKADFLRNISTFNTETSLQLIEKTLPVLLQCGHGELYSNSLHVSRSTLNNLLLSPAGVNLSCIVCPETESLFKILKSRRCFRPGFCANDYKATAASRLNASRLPAPSNSIESSNYVQRAHLNPKLISVLSHLHNALYKLQGEVVDGLTERVRDLSLNDLVNDAVLENMKTLDDQLKDVIVRNTMSVSHFLPERRDGGDSGGVKEGSMGVNNSSSGGNIDFSVHDIKNILCQITKLNYNNQNEFQRDKSYYNEPSQFGSGIPNLEFLAKNKRSTAAAASTNNNINDFGNRIDQLVDDATDDETSASKNSGGDVFGNIETLYSLERKTGGNSSSSYKNDESAGEEKGFTPDSMANLISYIFETVKRNIKSEEYAKLIKAFKLPLEESTKQNLYPRMFPLEERDQRLEGLDRFDHRRNADDLGDFIEYMDVDGEGKRGRGGKGGGGGGDDDDDDDEIDETDKVDFLTKFYTFINVFRKVIKPYFNSQKEKIKSIFRITSAIIHVNNFLKYGLSNSSSYDLSHLGANNDIPIDESVVFQLIQPIISFSYCKISALLYIKEIESRNDIITHRQMAVSFFNHADTHDIKRNGEFVLGKGGGAGTLGINLSTLVQQQSYLYSLNLDSLSPSPESSGDEKQFNIRKRCSKIPNLRRPLGVDDGYGDHDDEEDEKNNSSGIIQNNYSPFLTIPGHRKLQVSMPTDFSGLVTNTPLSCSPSAPQPDDKTVYLYTDAIIPFTTQLSITDCRVHELRGRGRMIPELFYSLRDVLLREGRQNVENDVVSFNDDKLEFEIKDLEKFIDLSNNNNINNKIIDNNNQGGDFWQFVRTASPSTNFLKAYFLKNLKTKKDTVGGSGDAADPTIKGGRIESSNAVLDNAEVLLRDIQNNLQRATNAIVKKNLEHVNDLKKLLYHDKSEEERLRRQEEQIIENNEMALILIKNVNENLLRVKPIADGFQQWKNNYLLGAEGAGGQKMYRIGYFNDGNDVFNSSRLFLSPTEASLTRSRYNDHGGLKYNFNISLRNFNDMYEESLEKMRDGGKNSLLFPTHSASSSFSEISMTKRKSISNLYKRYNRDPSFQNEFIKKVIKHFRNTRNLDIPNPEILRMTISNKSIFSVMASLIELDKDPFAQKRRLEQDEFYDNGLPKKKVVRDSDVLRDEIQLNNNLFY